MENKKFIISDTEAYIAILRDKTDKWVQFWYVITPLEAKQIALQVEQIEQVEEEIFCTLGITGTQVAARRFFVSDLATQYPNINSYRSRQYTDFYLSVTEQPPANGVKVCLLGMCLANITERKREERIFYFDTDSGIRHIFAEQFVAKNANQNIDAEKQMEAILQDLQDELSRLGASVQDNVLRTWIYAPHVDADYPGIVEARKRFFDSVSLTKDTHYIASTGIQGGSGNRFARVSLDAYAACGVPMAKIRYIQAPEHMSPTDLYGVTFERATAVQLGNTDFLFISGTASIDKFGEVVHPGDVVAQTERTLDNIKALLDASGFSWQDLSSFIVYLRDATDYNLVRPVLEEKVQDLPCVFVKAPVCRPGWLIEIEATAARVL